MFGNLQLPGNKLHQYIYYHQIELSDHFTLDNEAINNKVSLSIINVIPRATCLLDSYNTIIILQQSGQFICVFVHIIHYWFFSLYFPKLLKTDVVKKPLLKKFCLHNGSFFKSPYFKYYFFVKTN